MREIPTAISDPEMVELARLAAGKTVLELGSQYGYSTVHMAKVSELVVAVDHHRGDVNASYEYSLPRFLENLRLHDVEDKVIPIVGPIEDAVPLLADHQFGLVFVDADHEEASVLRDGQLAIRMVAPGGIIAFHDYGLFGVAPAVHQLTGGQDPYVVHSLAITQGW